MSKSSNAGSWLLVAAGLLGATGVALGAFHAHGMEKWLLNQLGMEAVSPMVLKRLDQVETGLKYQLAHAAALLGLVAVLRTSGGKLLFAAGTMLFVGTVLFSGSLYMIGLRGIKAFGAVAPLGGLSLMIGWALVALAGFRRSKALDDS